jgi:hypothetical protein
MSHYFAEPIQNQKPRSRGRQSAHFFPDGDTTMLGELVRRLTSAATPFERLHRIHTFMKPNLPTFITALVLCLGGLPLRAANFSSGSDGSLGALNVTVDTTIDLSQTAPNGQLNYTTVNVAAGTTLRFQRNPLNTPVFLLASGDVIIAGKIDVSGTQAPNANGGGGAPTGGVGGPGGFDGGKPGFSADIGPGSGYGPGAGKGGQNDFTADGAGAGSFGSIPTWTQSQNNHGQLLYGSPLLVPMIGGSGGGGSKGAPGFGGGGGGGAILIASSTSINITGQIWAHGGQALGSSLNAGSGGAVRLLAPVVRGTGTIDVQGDGGNDANAGAGRIRVDTIDRSNLQLNFAPLVLATVGADMFVFPAKVPRLDIVETAGTAIQPGTSQPVTVQLPFGANPNATVTVQAQDFGAVVPISVVLTPDSGDRIIVNSQIDNTTQSTASVPVPVTFPQNVLVTVNVWTR